MTSLVHWEALFGATDPASHLAVPSTEPASAPGHAPASKGINVVRFTLKPTKNGKFQVHYTQTLWQPK